jgi:hypothetical protein
MRTLTLFLALGYAAAAQTTTNVPGVTLSGPAPDPVIANHSDKQIIAAMLMLTHADGQVETQMNTFIERNADIPDAVANEIPDGGSKVWHTASKYRKVTNPVIAAKVAAVIFDDGELRGQDAYQFQAIKEREFQSIKQAFNLAKTGDWDKLKALSEDNSGTVVMGAAAARRLLGIHSSGGDINQLAHYGNLPAVTWRSSSQQAFR